MSEQFQLHHQLANDCFVIADLPLSQLLLCNDSAFPWFILVPKVDDIQDIYQALTPYTDEALAEIKLRILPKLLTILSTKN